MQDIEGFLNSFSEFKGKIRDNLASEFSKVLLSGTAERNERIRKIQESV